MKSGRILRPRRRLYSSPSRLPLHSKGRRPWKRWPVRVALHPPVRALTTVTPLQHPRPVRYPILRDPPCPRFSVVTNPRRRNHRDAHSRGNIAFLRAREYRRPRPRPPFPSSAANPYSGPPCDIRDTGVHLRTKPPVATDIGAPNIHRGSGRVRAGLEGGRTARCPRCPRSPAWGAPRLSLFHRRPQIAPPFRRRTPARTEVPSACPVFAVQVTRRPTDK